MSDAAEVSVEVTEPEPESVEEEPTVVVVENATEEATEVLRDEHSDRHSEHEARHDRESQEIRETLGTVLAGLNNLGERIDSLDQRMSTTTEVAFQAMDAAESVEAELEETHEEASTTDQAIEVAEPQSDVPEKPKEHWLRRAGW